MPTIIRTDEGVPSVKKSKRAAKHSLGEIFPEIEIRNGFPWVKEITPEQRDYLLNRGYEVRDDQP